MTKKEEAQAKREERVQKERQRTFLMQEYERKAEERFADASGRTVLICGVDEAGRGPFAGPVVAGAVILNRKDPEKEILYLNDSKKLSEKKREQLYREILKHAEAVGIGYASAGMIDRINILQATFHAMRMAVNNLSDVSFLVREDDPVEDVHALVRKLVKYEIPDAGSPDEGAEPESHVTLTPDYILADAVHIPDIAIPQEGIVKGDAKSISIAAGSIIAKVTRDHIMYEYDRQYPQYGFASHKGYGTKAHIEAIREYGMSPIHRRTFIHF